MDTVSSGVFLSSKIEKDREIALAINFYAEKSPEVDPDNLDSFADGLPLAERTFKFIHGATEDVFIGRQDIRDIRPAIIESINYHKPGFDFDSESIARADLIRESEISLGVSAELGEVLLFIGMLRAVKNN